MAHQIKCITKPERENHHEAITDVGGVSHGGPTTFYITRKQCVEYIHKGESFFVRVGNDQIAVEAYQRNNNWFIKTKPDATTKDNLLSLPRCQ